MNLIKYPTLKGQISDNFLAETLAKSGVNIDQDLLADDYVGEPLKNYLYLTYLPELLEVQLDELTKYYNRYFWLSKVAARYKKKFKRDDGFEQQVFKILEEADTLDEEVDWNIVEEIQKLSSNN